MDRVAHRVNVGPPSCHVFGHELSLAPYSLDVSGYGDQRRNAARGREAKPEIDLGPEFRRRLASDGAGRRTEPDQNHKTDCEQDSAPANVPHACYSLFSRRAPSTSACHPDRSVTVNPSMRRSEGALSAMADL